MPPHTRIPSIQDRNALGLANRGDGRVALAPIFFNGQARVAIVYVHANNGHPIMQILGICPGPEDQLTDIQGLPASTEVVAVEEHGDQKRALN